MNGKERDEIRGVQGELKEVRRDIEAILKNHLPHIMVELGQLWSVTESARFRAGVVIVGLALIGIMIAVLGIVIATVVAG